MPIQKLADYLINRLKAWEIVERPASILKELVENSLDAEATKIEISLVDGGKTFLSVQDNGTGIELSDMDLVLERYATSKIRNDEDLYNIASYGFRGEALASISEVSKTTILTKTAFAQIGTKLVKKGAEVVITNQPVGFEKGTLVQVEDLFYNVPARLKFLKSSQTEFFYCYNYFLDFALWHYDKEWILKKNDKIVFDLKPVRDLKERITDLYKKDWNKNLKEFVAEDDYLKIRGVVSDASLRFGSMENIKIYVNGRIVQDKIVKKAIMDAYHRQIAPGEYPFVILMVDIDPKMVDVNVHPAKLQVKFVDHNKVYGLVYQKIREILGENKIQEYFFDKKDEKADSSSFSFWENKDTTPTSDSAFQYNSQPSSQPKINPASLSFEDIFPEQNEKPTINQQKITMNSIFGLDQLTPTVQKTFFTDEIGEYQVIGQVWNSYIVLQSRDALFYIDQHALAERIAFETMKKEQDLSQEPLLQPLKFEITQVPNLEEKIEELNELGFDISFLGENVIVIYAIPHLFLVHPVDIQTLFNHVLYLEKISFDQLVEGAYATRACKTSIKAGNKLSLPQMEQLVQEGFEKIPWMFVCQHGRPFFVRVEKKEIDKFFDR